MGYTDVLPLGRHRHQADEPRTHQTPDPHGHRYALDKKLPSVTLMHKGNIMKFTEGAFKDWGYELAKEEFRDQIVTEDEVYKGADATGKVLIKDRIADSMFQQIQLRPDEYSVVATPNLNGDYLSDAVAALMGGIGLAAGANIGDKAAMFEATHGTAPEVHRQEHGQPRRGAAVGRAAAGAPGLVRGGRAGEQGRGSDLRRERGDGPERPGRQAVRDLRHRPPVPRLRRKGRRVAACEFAERIIHHL